MYKFINKCGGWLFISKNDAERAEKLFDKRGRLIVFIGRLMPGIRSLVSIPAGICKMDFKLYTIYTLAGSSIWNTLLLSSGYFLKDHYKGFLHAIESYEKVILLILCMAIAAYLFIVIFRNFNREN
jgi:membrane protein DedA with SNARE-associated domain